MAPDALGPIFTAHLYAQVETQLLELLRSLSPEEWQAQTVAPKWKVKHVVAHLLDTQLRKLSAVRDRTIGPAPEILSAADLVAFINYLNEEGVKAYGRLSPQVLTAMMEFASRESAAFHQALDPMAPALFPVSWAGEQTSLNWFDTARELTERWHHQQQIRLAVNRPGIMTRELYQPVLDCFMRGLPHHYSGVTAPSGTLLEFVIEGDCGGSWWLYRNGEVWMLAEEKPGKAVARTSIPQEIAWRIFTKGIDRAEATTRVRLEGDTELGSRILRLVAIIG